MSGECRDVINEYERDPAFPGGDLGRWWNANKSGTTGAPAANSAPGVSVEPECSEVINGPNLGGFLGLAPDL